MVAMQIIVSKRARFFGRRALKDRREAKIPKKPVIGPMFDASSPAVNAVNPARGFAKVLIDVVRKNRGGLNPCGALRLMAKVFVY